MGEASSTRQFGDAVAELCASARIDVVTAVPGHGVSACFGAVQARSGKPGPWSFHEEVAYSMAHGASLAGGRALCMMKTHGFLKAANAISDSLYSGARAALVLLAFHDPTGEHSDTHLEIEPVARALSVPVRRPAFGDFPAAFEEAVTEAERARLPQLLIADASWAERAPADRDIGGGPAAPGEALAPEKNVCAPIFATYQKRVLDAKLAGRDWSAVEAPEKPVVPEGLPERFAAAAQDCMPFFDAFREFDPGLVCGDTSIPTLFCLPPYERVHACTHMGGSVPLGAGALMAGAPDVWSITGDFSFLAAGHMALLEVVQRKLPLKIAIFENGCAGATGGQPLDASLLDRVLLGYEANTRALEASRDRGACREALEAMRRSDEMAILRVKIAAGASA